jgi:hypothetical protein
VIYRSAVTDANRSFSPEVATEPAPQPVKTEIAPVSSDEPFIVSAPLAPTVNVWLALLREDVVADRGVR